MSKYKPFNSNSTDEYTLGQAWHVYAGNDITYSPFEGYIAKAINDILANDITIAVFMNKSNNKESFYAIGKKHWIALNEAYDNKQTYKDI
ncbi:TPA: hypothetical protein EYO57_24615 [Candidatus Poribacteria bacterium]|nr:hypothetical protein [Candidatus Poribacteria bacterium]